MRTDQEQEAAFGELTKIVNDWSYDEKVKAYFKGMADAIECGGAVGGDMVNLLNRARRFVIGLYDDGQL